MTNFNSINDLPPPGAVALAVSEALIDVIHEEIAACNGQISFARFMELALYAPGLGYYAAGSHKLGEAGDFVTAPEISGLYSRCVARQCEQVLQQTAGDILEFGAGRGVMAADILTELATRGCLPEHYYILELSSDLRERQFSTLSRTVPEHHARVVWLDELPQHFDGVVLANEVLDAMPVHRFHINREGNQECHVSWQDGLVVHNGPCSDEVARALSQIQAGLAEPLADGYHSEINLAAVSWIDTVAKILRRGLMLIMDYGYTRREYYSAERYEGTLVCHYRHRRLTDPLQRVGLQDITAHVDFTAVAEAALLSSLDVLGYTPQAQFLLSAGITGMLAESDPDDMTRHLQLSQQVKQLTLPGEMGEMVKFMALGREVEPALLGFTLKDLRGRL